VFYIDPASNLIAKQAYVGPGGNRPLVEESFSDYRPVDGVQIAFTAEMQSAGRRLVSRRVTDMKLNAPLDPSLFQRPAS